VMTAEGYPGPFERGRTILGVEDAEAMDGVFVFHAGTAHGPDGRLVTSGGRVLNVCARGRGLSQALATAKQAAGKIRFDGAHFRRDIGHKALEILMERSGSMLR